MSEEIIKVLDAVCDKIGIAVDWSAENITPQMMDLFKRYGNYLFADAVFSSVSGFLCFFAGIFIVVATYKSQKNEGWAGRIGFCSGLAIATYSASIFLIAIGFFVFLFGISDAIKGYMVPEVLAAERIITMIQN